MKIYLAADHAGYQLKKSLHSHLKKKGFEVEDLGTDSESVPTDYPDFAAKVCESVRADPGPDARGIIVCGSGVGASVAANKFPGIRAAVCHDAYSAHQGVEHDDMNVLCLGGRIIGVEPAKEIAEQFLGARYTGEERHRRRLGKISAIEGRFLRDRSAANSSDEEE